VGVRVKRKGGWGEKYKGGRVSVVGVKIVKGGGEGVFWTPG